MREHADHKKFEAYFNGNFLKNPYEINILVNNPLNIISANKSVAQHSPCKEDLLWDPSLTVGVSDEDGKTVLLLRK